MTYPGEKRWTEGQHELQLPCYFRGTLIYVILQQRLTIQFKLV